MIYLRIIIFFISNIGVGNVGDVGPF